MKSRLLTVALVAGALMSSTAFAQTVTPTDVPGHPRVNEIDQRDANQQNRINAGVADGQINAKQAARDDTRLQKDEQRQSADEAKHGGHLTKREQRRLNRGLNKNSRHIHNQRHQ
jgi:opacity protein-like surface antigen